MAISGRDAFIVARACAFAIAAIDAAPPERRAHSDRAAMVRMFLNLCPEEFEQAPHLRHVEAATGRMPTLKEWPEEAAS